LRVIWEGRAAQDRQWSGRWCHVLDGVLGALEVIEEIKSPCVGRGC